jgi:RNA-directed DNA polymerase
VRYADDFVILARYQGQRIGDWVQATVEDWMGLAINREKTRVVQLKDAGASLDFLGFSFRYEPDKFGRPQRFLNRVPSAKACTRERSQLRGLINARCSHVPIPELIGRVNAQVRGWAGYFRHGRSRPAFRALNWYLQQRMVRHLKRRSQRPYRPPEGVSWYAHLYRQLGLVQL